MITGSLSKHARPTGRVGLDERFVVAFEADADLTEQFTYIASDNIAAAERFLLNAYETFQRLAAMPGVGCEVDLTHPPGSPGFAAGLFVGLRTT